MKTPLKTLIVACGLLLSNYATAQAPEGINYQATVRNSSGALITNQSVAIIFTIKKITPSGTTVYSETQTKTTNAYGGFSAVIGKGTSTLGMFNAIAWGTDKHFLNVNVNGNDLGTTQLMSVPYALHAKTSDDSQWKKIGNDIVNKNTAGKVGVGFNTPKHQLSVGKTNNPDISIGTFAFNKSESGRLVFSERVLDSGVCGFSFDHNGLNNQLVLKTGCTNGFTTDTALSYTRDGQTRITKLRVGSSTVNPINALSVTGNVDVSGSINRIATGTANLVPIAYGSVSSSGIVSTTGSTSNFTVTKTTTGLYTIEITGENFFYNKYSVSVSRVGIGFISFTSASGKLQIGTYDLSGTATDAIFSFIVYKP